MSKDSDDPKLYIVMIISMKRGILGMRKTSRMVVAAHNSSHVRLWPATLPGNQSIDQHIGEMSIDELEQGIQCPYIDSQGNAI